MTDISLVFATGNRAKLAQMAFVISSLCAPIKLISAYERYRIKAHYEERGKNALAIAQLGATMLATRLGIPVVVEDTTFHVSALGDEPGVRAGAYLKEHGRAGILKALGDRLDRDARIVSALAWATPWGDTQTWVTVVHGHIAQREWYGRNLPEWIAPTPSNPLGGGYNAIFIPRGETRTLAEIPPDEALQWGYREPNFAALVAFLMEHNKQKR